MIGTRHCELYAGRKISTTTACTSSPGVLKRLSVRRASSSAMAGVRACISSIVKWYCSNADWSTIPAGRVDTIHSMLGNFSSTYSPSKFLLDAILKHFHESITEVSRAKESSRQPRSESLNVR